MRLVELKSITADDVLAYVQSRHENFNIPNTITDHPTWRKIRVPLTQLHIPDDESGTVENDPYNRAQMIDMDHVQELDRAYIERHPIVVDTDGWIIDGNHRAIAARLGGLFDIPAYIPA